jgi:hypothetical protein
VQADEQCQHAACISTCGSAGYTAYTACQQGALACPCDAYQSAFLGCYQALVSAGSPAAACLGHTFNDELTMVWSLFCGP